mmetsp:Transcript_1737/g.7759  ORF Transcript_1737/g.7759 Transcript_1737/m.7759 type:complete len:110 (+) Transcript_1737:885-1214(+)
MHVFGGGSCMRVYIFLNSIAHPQSNIGPILCRGKLYLITVERQIKPTHILNNTKYTNPNFLAKTYFLSHICHRNLLRSCDDDGAIYAGELHVLHDAKMLIRSPGWSIDD